MSLATKMLMLPLVAVVFASIGCKTWVDRVCDSLYQSCDPQAVKAYEGKAGKRVCDAWVDEDRQALWEFNKAHPGKYDSSKPPPDEQLQAFFRAGTPMFTAAFLDALKCTRAPPNNVACYLDSASGSDCAPEPR